MDDEIDIEEHDLLDNPVIKRLFPDLSILKREVIDDYDQRPMLEQNAVKVDCVQKFESLNDNDPLPLEENITEDQDRYKGIVPLHGNKIILGSKPNKNKPERNVCSNAVSLYNTMVKLTDKKPFLDSCKRYCEICLILFPTKEAFKLHRNSYHMDLSTNYSEIESYSESIKTHEPKNIFKNKCNICNKTFSGISNLNKHMRNIHVIKKKSFKQSRKINRNIKDNVPKPAVSCFHCNVIFPNMQSLIEHLYDTMGTKKPNNIRNEEKDGLHNQNLSKGVEHSILKANQTSENLNKVKINKVGSKDPAIFVYRCRVCSYYFNNAKFISLHLFKKHNIKDSALPEKILYDPKCKFCTSEFSKASSYNTHIQKVHRKKLFAKISKKSKKLTSFSKCGRKEENDISIKLMNKEDTASSPPTPILGSKENYVSGILKSVLFRCNRCDIHFLNSQVAMDHVGHIEILLNWKCSICKHIFKKNDEKDHMEQHLVTNDFTVYCISESTPSLILYNCPKCCVHFDENLFLQHFPVCETVSVNHVKCKLCGILIENSLECLHNDHHRKGIVKSTDFVIVNSDVIQNSKNEVSCKMNHKELTVNHKELTANHKELRTRNVNINNEIPTVDIQLFKVYYCQTCKCFVNETTILKHKSTKCLDDEPTIVCILCGLIFPRKNTSSHSRLHTKKTDLTLQDFEFYDLKRKPLIYPPIPEFPHCSVCEIYFPRLNFKLRHICGAEEYITCSKCKLKFSELGYKLHMNYHDYRLHNYKSLTNTTEKLNTIQTAEKSNFEGNNNIIIYTCKHCNVSLSDYDLVIEHCQEHFNPNKIKGSSDVCKICNLVFDKKYYKNHEEIHLRNFNKKKFKIIEFDTFGFKSDYNSWIEKVFNTLPQEQRQNIIDESIYKYENKIKMQVIQEGSWHVTLYKCDICNCFIDPKVLIKHLGNNCQTLRNHTCKICFIPFVSQGFKLQHEEIHNKPFKGLKSYRIVLFNRKDDEALNSSLHSDNYFTLHKCTKCTGIVNKNEQKDHLCNRKDLKVCTHCGLLIYSKDFNSHLSKHKMLDTFNPKNMKIIDFDRSNEDKDDKKYDKKECSSKRKKRDYQIYKCKKCQVCISDERSSLKHDCSLVISKSKCSICGFYWEGRNLKYHYALHESDCNFANDNITLIDFDNTESRQRDCNLAGNSIANNVVEEKNKVVSPTRREVLKNTKPFHEELIKLYRCPCGLHFLDRHSVVTHNYVCSLKPKISRQQCSKCGLYFNPNILFKHLVKHHGNKDVIYKFDIIDVLNKNHGKKT